jgi:hypothetical protein
MQPTKDSFYVTLRDRLAASDPQRTMTLNGVTRPAILVLENEAPAAASTPGAFCLRWGSARPAQTSTSPLLAMECTVSYRSSGTLANSEFDRGRELGSMDADLLTICAPRCAAKCDYSGGSAAPLGSMLFWTRPLLAAAKEADGQFVGREASITVYFYPEGSEL